MLILIKKLIKKTAAGNVYQDSELQTPSLTIGRGTDQQVFLSDLHVSLEHAVIKPMSGRKFSIQAAGSQGIRVNGRLKQKAVIDAGDTLTIGRVNIKLLEPDSIHQLVLLIDESQVAEESAKISAIISLRRTGATKRIWSWMLFSTIIVMGLALPVWNMLQPQKPDVLAFIEKLPNDDFWLSGQLSRAHSFFGRDCNACHKRPFEQVNNAACANCHDDLPNHANDPHALQVSGLDDFDCTYCHREHNGFEGIIATAPSLCTDCHASPHLGDDMLGRAANLRNFDIDHPEFRIVLTRFDDSGGWTESRLPLDDQGISEHSGLVFPHELHLDPAGIDGPEGSELLECTNCHVSDQAEVGMREISMNRHCARCHRLDFEPAEPARRLPHGDVEEVTRFLIDFYARRALEGGIEDSNAPRLVQQRRRPGLRLSRAQQQVALDWARQRASQVTSEIFEYRVCYTCHEITNQDGWIITPVHINDTWMPAADFTHGDHNDVSCETCHAAPESSESTDILMPGIAVCRDCHGDQASMDIIPTRCIDCHGFHIARDTMMMKPADKSLE